MGNNLESNEICNRFNCHYVSFYANMLHLIHTLNKQLPLGLLVVLLACGNSQTEEDQECIDPQQIDPNGVCIEIYDPVCGCNGKTYSNICYAETQGVTLYEKGACD